MQFAVAHSRQAFLLLCCWLWLAPVIAQSPVRHTVSGYVYEAGSREALPGVNVRLANGTLGTQTNTFGFFSLTLPGPVRRTDSGSGGTAQADSATLLISLVGYQTLTHTLALHQHQQLQLTLTAGEQLTEVVVRDHRQQVGDSPQMSKLELPVDQIKKIPALLGEKDVLKVLQLMPGVQKGSEGQTGLYVRGGGPDQNLIVLDDAVVYNASHLFGFFSVFNGDALKSVELTKGGFPARFGGRLSSVIDLTMKDGARDKVHGEVGLGIVAARAVLEGPLSKSRPGHASPGSFIISARRTYLDAVSGPIMKAQTKGASDAGYYFYDLNAKLNYDLGPRDRLYVSGYLGRDKFWSSDSASAMSVGMEWGNATGSLRWNHQFSQRLFANTSLIYSNYEFNVSADQLVEMQNRFKLNYTSGIRDFSIKHDLDYYPSLSHALRVGAQLTAHRFTPSAVVVQNAGLPSQQQQDAPIDVLEGGIYAEDTWRPNTHWRVNGGLRLSSFTGSGVAYLRPEPRLSLGYKLSESTSMKASYALMNQYVHLLSNTGIGLPTDLWVPTTDLVKPQQSQQVALGLAKDFAAKGLALTVEGYYKQMDNIISYKEGASFLAVNSPTSTRQVRWEDNVTAGKGWSYGAEVLLQKKEGRLSGWVGYTLSWTQWQFADLNNGHPFFPRNDRRHDISVVGMYDLNPHITLSATWVYGTGQALTVPTARYRSFGIGSAIDASGTPASAQAAAFTNTSVSDFGAERNTFRAEPYHRLDLGVQFHRKRPTHASVWEFSIYNAYNRRNPFFYNLEGKKQTGNQPVATVLYKYSVFPVVPSVSYTYKF
ncbi:TonB-dependent receptor [Fibrella aquatilis]|uniref:TonB-dependent receptor n=1 Tax=Fibrella aquatilis TaxID=2817059 RepID=A0A939G308_9BACT|nr:TonB-dependent receptor [Fibrella aquatilis]MBO0931407.1 TonB-dependent receptor [Fibrella aquatilis]